MDEVKEDVGERGRRWWRERDKWINDKGRHMERKKQIKKNKVERKKERKKDKTRNRERKSKRERERELLLDFSGIFDDYDS